MSGIVDIYTSIASKNSTCLGGRTETTSNMGSWGRVESKKVDWTQSALEKMWHALYNMGSNTFVGIEKICKC
jgi:hypothetical protein